MSSRGFLFLGGKDVLSPRKGLMVSKKAVILGYDAVSPLGTDLDHQWQRAVAGDCGIGKLTRFPLTADFPVRVAG